MFKKGESNALSLAIASLSTAPTLGSSAATVV